MSQSQPGAQQGAPNPSAPTPGTPEYDAAMAAKYDGQGSKPEVPPLTDPTPADKPSKPDWLPEKFWNGEKGEADFAALAKSYAELEKSKSAAPGEGGNKDNKQGDVSKDGDNAAPLDFNAVAQELYGEGLSDGSRAALVKMGLPEDLIGEVQQAFKDQVELMTLRMESHAGGKEKLAELQAWGKANLSESDRQLIDTQINSGQWQAALDYLAFKRSQAPATKPNMITGGAPASGDATFTSQAEMMAAIRDPRYATDPVYRRSVEQRIVRSSFR